MSLEKSYDWAMGVLQGRDLSPWYVYRSRALAVIGFARGLVATEGLRNYVAAQGYVAKPGSTEIDSAKAVDYLERLHACMLETTSADLGWGFYDKASAGPLELIYHQVLYCGVLNYQLTGVSSDGQAHALYRLVRGKAWVEMEQAEGYLPADPPPVADIPHDVFDGWVAPEKAAQLASRPAPPLFRCDGCLDSKELLDLQPQDGELRCYHCADKSKAGVPFRPEDYHQPSPVAGLIDPDPRRTR